jgi:hypothetical protein
MKRKISLAKGTSCCEVEVGPSLWAGKSFLEYQKKMMTSLPKSKVISLKRGTKKIPALEYPESRRVIPIGVKIVTQRGTSTSHL